MSEVPKLSTRTAVGYAVGDFGINLYFISTLTFLLIFYTDVMGISAAAAGGVFALARFVDAVTDPLMGMLAERTRTRWGRMRPYILWGALPLGVISVLTFTVPDLNESGRVLWAYVTYILFGILFTLVGIPYSTLTASLTDDHDERTRLSTIRIGLAFAGGFLCSVGMPFLVQQFDDPAQGYQWVMVGFAVIATVSLGVTFSQTREVVQPPERERLSLKLSMKCVFLNPPLLVVMGMFCLGMLAFTVRQTSTAYFFTYNVGDPSLISLFFGVTLAVMLVGIWSVPWLADRFGKAGAARLGAYFGLIGCIGFYLTPPDAVVMIFVWGCVMALGGTPIAVLGWAMIPDTVEYALWRHGARADGAIYSMASFFQKLAKTVGGAGVAFALAAAGYVANAAVQTPDAANAVHAMMSLVPGGILVLLIILTHYHRLDSDAHAKLVADVG